MNGCHLKDTACKLGTQTIIYEGTESVLGRKTEKTKQTNKNQGRESHYHSQMFIAY